MAGAPFLDSNILVYAHSDDPRASQAQLLCQQPHTLSVQSLNEFANVASRKLGFAWPEITEALASIVALADRVVPLTFDIHRAGIVIATRYRLQTYDAMIAAAAIDAGCELLYSEDMQSRLIIEDRLTIQNPFA